MYNVLTAPGMLEAMDFAYYPCNHVGSNGKFLCGPGLDCYGTWHDSCLVHTYCWEGQCSSQTQLRISKFLHCLEGPNANAEKPVNATMRPICMKEAGLDSAPVNACVANLTLLHSIEKTLNVSKGKMMAALGSNPEYFPHMWIDDKPLRGFTWTTLQRSICDALASRGADALPAACQGAELTLKLTISSPSLTLSQFKAASGYTAQIEAAFNNATSRQSLPVRFTIANGYVPNVEAVTPASTSLVAAQAGAGTIIASYQSTVLQAFVNQSLETATNATARAFTAQYLAQTLSEATNLPLSAADITAWAVATQ